LGQREAGGWGSAAGSSYGGGDVLDEWGRDGSVLGLEHLEGSEGERLGSVERGVSGFGRGKQERGGGGRPAGDGVGARGMGQGSSARGNER